MSTQTFDRTKPHLNIGTIGHVAHGKTTLTAAITRALGSAVSYADIAGKRGIVRKDRIATVTADHVEYETAQRHYAHVDSALDGLMPQTREHILLARQVGVPAIVVALNMIDLADDLELVELIEEEIREVLEAFGFPGAEIPFVRISALSAAEGDEQALAQIRHLMDEVDRYVPTPERDTERPFLLRVENACTIPGRGTVVTGRIERGLIEVGDPVELVGLREPRKSVVTGIQAFHRDCAQGLPGDSVGLLLRGVRRDEVERGMVLAAPGSVVPQRRFRAQLYVLSKEEGGRRLPFCGGYSPQFFFGTTDVTGQISLGPDIEMCMPGENAEVRVELQKPVALEEQFRFAVREGGKTVASGQVIEILEA